jgi:hypothetical protein
MVEMELTSVKSVDVENIVSSQPRETKVIFDVSLCTSCLVNNVFYNILGGTYGVEKLEVLGSSHQRGASAALGKQ